VQTSGLFDPGYLIQSIGFKYGIEDRFFTRAGVAFKETFSSEYRIRRRQGYSGRNRNLQVPDRIESATGVKLTVMENVLSLLRVESFSAFDKLDTWDVRWDNTHTAKVNRLHHVSLNVLWCTRPRKRAGRRSSKHCARVALLRSCKRTFFAKLLVLKLASHPPRNIARSRCLCGRSGGGLGHVPEIRRMVAESHWSLS
jgi:hypothetical protein